MAQTTGRIVKGIAGFYYVYTEEYGCVECHAKGILRKGKYRPLVGDYVDIEVIDDNEKLGSLVGIHERKNSLIRPEVANVDRAVLIFAFESPEPNLILLDRFLIMLEKQGVDCIICFNKDDLADEEKKERLLAVYDKCGFEVIGISAREQGSTDAIMKLIGGRTTVFAGPSGVGKSTMINMICPDALMETGDISRKTSRGKHTTRHSQLFNVGKDTYIMDTPGFTALELMEGMDRDELKAYYREFFPYEGKCRYDACSHTHEPECAVKAAVQSGGISSIRYDNYKYLYNELKEKKKYRE